MNHGQTTAQAYVGIGSNLGNRAGAMRTAVKLLHRPAEVVVDFGDGIASLYETSALASEQGVPDFLNSCVRIETLLSPHDLLAVMLSIEETLGRTRDRRNAARVIDLDLLLYADRVVDDKVLTLPHPRLHERRFVLEPLAELAGNVRHPRLDTTIERLAAGLRERAAEQRVVRVAGRDWCRESNVSATPRTGQ